METKKLGRRDIAKLLGLGGLVLGGLAVVNVPGCGTYEAESGDAFEPWNFPGDETRAEYLAAMAALLAASPHNTQPWGFVIQPDAIEMHARLDRNLGEMDGLLREMYIGLGCALENLVLAAQANGRDAAVTLLPEGEASALVARIVLTPAAPRPSALYDAISKRHTNRGPYVDSAAAPGLERALRELVVEPEVTLRWLGTDAERAAFREQTIAATEAIIADRIMNEAGERWYRHTAEDILANRDGTSLDATGNGAFIRTLGKSFSRPTLETTNKYWLAATKARNTTGSAYAILCTSSASTRAEQLACGRAYQRLHLWAQSQGMAMQPLNQLPERQDREEKTGIEPRFGKILAELLGQNDLRAQMAFRIGYPWDAAFASARRPLEWVTL